MNKSIVDDLALKLTTIPKCPQGQAIVDSFVQDLNRICGNLDDARWVVETACAKWHSWHGIAGLKELLEERAPVDPPNKFVEYRPTAVGCEQCNDYGWYQDENKLCHWCFCGMGIEQQRKRPDFLAALNRNHETRKVARLAFNPPSESA